MTYSFCHITILMHNIHQSNYRSIFVIMITVFLSACVNRVKLKCHYDFSTRKHANIASRLFYNEHFAYMHIINRESRSLDFFRNTSGEINKLRCRSERQTIAIHSSFINLAHVREHTLRGVKSPLSKLFAFFFHVAFEDKIVPSRLVYELEFIDATRSARLHLFKYLRVHLPTLLSTLDVPRGGKCRRDEKIKPGTYNVRRRAYE